MIRRLIRLVDPPKNINPATKLSGLALKLLAIGAVKEA